jgi:O-antigen ligase|tara:strand:- start:18552 stop:20000 length:1449 start_codon:yes stop_codon:yes gene_type:complete
MKSAKRKLGRMVNRLSAPAARFYAFVAFFVIAFFMGGGSRDDIQSLLVLRPLAIIFCAYALTVKARGQWNGRMFPLYIASALAALMLLQLIPLPPGIWTLLPERHIFADIADIAGIEQPWRPLSLSPSKTLNSLFSLSVPIAAIMLYLNLEGDYRKRVVPVLIILFVMSAIWAIFQVIGPPRGPLYLYRITNFGMGVGLFANRNHQAVMLAASIAMLGWYAGSLRSYNKQAALKFSASIAVIFVFVPLIFITGSRAGLLLMIPALILALFLIYFGGYLPEKGSKNGLSATQQNGFLSGRRVIVAIGIAAISGMTISSLLLSRSLAFDRLFSGDGLEDMRLQILPTLFTMLRDYMPWGSGFGSFEHVYKIYEPQELLRPTYLNQAHNDWLQYPIEGGAPALIIAVFALVGLVRRVWVGFKCRFSSSAAKYRVLMCLGVILFLLAASIGDYPLRVPSIMAVFVVLICVLDDGIYSLRRHDLRSR